MKYMEIRPLQQSNSIDILHLLLQKEKINIKFLLLILKAPKEKIVDFANSAAPAEVAHNEPPHLILHCLPSSF